MKEGKLKFLKKTVTCSNCKGIIIPNTKHFVYFARGNKVAARYCSEVCRDKSAEYWDKYDGKIKNAICEVCGDMGEVQVPCPNCNSNCTAETPQDDLDYDCILCPECNNTGWLLKSCPNCGW